MSVLIKGMKMPTGCDDCFLPLRYCPYAMRPDGDCPLVEIPPHGRLIDADALQKRMIDYGWKHPDSTVHEFLEDDAPTIIEAEEGER